MRGRFKRIVLLSMIVLVVLVPSVAAAEVPVSGPSGGQDVRVQPEASGVTIDLALPDYKIEDVVRDGVTYQQIVVDSDGWAQAGLAGAPRLPERGLMVAVPPTGDVTLEIIDAAPLTAAGSYRLDPAPFVTLEEDRLVETWQPSPDKYAEAAWTPAAQAEIAQEGWLRGYRFVRLSLRPFQYNPASGEIRVASTLRVRLAFSEPGPSVRSLPVDSIYAPVYWSTFANYDQAKDWQTRPESDAVEPRQIDTASQVKVTVNADGLYRVTYNDLSNAGVTAGTLNTLNPRTFRLLDAGVEQHIYVVGENDGVFNPSDTIQFYGLRNKAALSDDNNVYWLTWGGADGLRIASQNAVPGSASFATTLLTTAHAEQNLEYKQQRPFVDWLQPVLYDQWYWKQVITPETVTFQNVKADTASSVQPVASMWLAGDGDLPANYTVSLSLNGAAAVNKSWTQTKVLDGSLLLPAGALVNGANTLALTPINVPVWLDWLELTYPYNGDYLSGALFHNPTAGTWRYRITNSPSATPWVLNVGEPSQPRLLTGVASTATGSTYTLTWEQATTATDRLVVIPDSEVRQPAAVQLYVDAGLLATNQQVDYLIISHGDLIASVQPLAAMHAANGLSVKVVNVADIYDTFSDGSVSAAAIKDYLAYVYVNYPWPVPTYVLLVGDGNVNLRFYRPSPSDPLYPYYTPNLIPPYMGGFDAWGGASISDNAFTLLQGNDLLGEMIISRFPVNNATEAQTVVDKTLNYASTFPADRAHSTLWIADNPDNDLPQYGTQFHQAADETIAGLSPAFAAERVYYCQPGLNACANPPINPWVHTTVPAARAAIVSGWNRGHLLAYYTGHGSNTVWANEQLFYAGNYLNFTNATALPFLLISSCTNGFFADPYRRAIDEVLLRVDGRGTIGGFTGVTFDTLQPQTELLKEFVRAVMDEGITQTGVAATVARARIYGVLPYPENERTSVGHGLSGDPALQLAQPDTCVRGDLNCDDHIDIMDVQQVAGVWNTVAWSIGYNPRADLVRDGRIDVNDIIAVAGLWHSQ